MPELLAYQLIPWGNFLAGGYSYDFSTAIHINSHSIQVEIDSKFSHKPITIYSGGFQPERQCGKIKYSNICC
jgi:hypothetical protein